MPRPQRLLPLVALAAASLAAACDVEAGGMGAPLSPEGLWPSHPDAHVEPSTPEADPLADAAISEPSGSDAGGGCNLEGTFALRIDANVSWAGTTLFGIVPIILQSSAPLTITTVIDVKQGPTGLVSTLRACGATIPDFSASVGERYGVVIPDANWEKLNERWQTNIEPACNTPGCKYTSGLLSAQIGIEMPALARWPSPRDKLDPTSFRDADGDGLPGFLLLARNELDGPNYKHPPTSYVLLERISEMMLAIRVSAALDGKVESCERLGGDTKNLVIETRALGCRVDAGELCRPDQLDFLDDNLPVWTVDNAKWRALRVPATTGCADARAAFQSAP